MSISTFMGLQTALRGLLGEQEAIDTTSHNIANANTPGYSRQTAVMAASTPLTIPDSSNLNGVGAQIGTGVDVTTFTRIRNQFLDVQYRTQNTTTSSDSTTMGQLDQVQTALDEPSANGISTQLATFWNSWSDVANAPQSAAARQTLVDNATTLAQTFNAVDQQLATIQSQSAQQYNAVTGTGGQVQSDATQIASLNGAISHALSVGQNPNDLMDQRDKLLDDLSGLAGVKVTDPGSGLLVVNFGDAATPLVNGTTVTWPQSMTSAAGGQLGALLGLSGAAGQIQTYRTALDGIANGLITAVNALHTATPFFSGSSAATIAVAVTPSQVQTTTTGAAGANDVALAIAGLRGGATDQSYAAFVSQVGSDTQSVTNAQQTQSNLLSSIDNQRKSVAGVSLDEEMTNLMLFQRGYQASARTMTTMDSMLDTLINHTGTVGL